MAPYLFLNFIKMCISKLSGKIEKYNFICCQFLGIIFKDTTSFQNYTYGFKVKPSVIFGLF